MKTGANFRPEVLAILLSVSCSITESEFTTTDTDRSTSASVVGMSDPAQLEDSSDNVEGMASRGPSQMSPCTEGRDCELPRCTGSNCPEINSPQLSTDLNGQNSGSTEEPACSDLSTNGTESDVDCGGECPERCDTGFACESNSDCASAICISSLCAPASCEDNTRNQEESDTDCGGSQCPPCSRQQRCNIDSDCANALFCTEESQVCTPFSCEDFQQNGEESDVDCGGPCPRCDTGQLCSEPEDCTSNICDTVASGQPTQCQAASCTDGIRNQTETGIDCGGPCDPCGTLEGCSVANDCNDRVCDQANCPPGLDSCCQAPTCTDGVTNGGEVSVDCGSPASSCSACEAGATCSLNNECASGQCDSVCLAIDSCTDGSLSPEESDVDCGGDCQSCSGGDACLVDTDCSTNACVGGICCGDSGALCIRCAERRTAPAVQCSNLVNPTDAFNCQNFLACLAGNPAVCTSLLAPGCTDGEQSVCNGNFFGGISGVAVLTARQIVTAAACLP